MSTNIPPSNTSTTNIQQPQGNKDAHALPRSTSGLPPFPPSQGEQYTYLPMANIMRVMRRVLPSNAKVSKKAKTTIQESVSEFISFVTGEAMEQCNNEKRKTITAEDLISSMSRLGFDEYIEPLTLYLKRYRESVNGKSLDRDEQVQGPMPVVALVMMVPPPMMSPIPTYNPYAGVGFGFSYDFSTIANPIRSPNSTNVGGVTGNQEFSSSVDGMRFEVGSSSNNGNMLGFDYFDNPFVTSSSNDPNGVATQDVECSDNCTQLK